MKCPFCGADETRVADSRLTQDGTQVRRRRECPTCGERFTTFETAELQLPRIIKRDGTRELFSQDKLRRGMLRALEKRPVPTERVEEAVTHIERELMKRGEREVEARFLGEMVMDALRKLDQVAYIRFASVYKSFEDVAAFRELIERLQQESRER